MYKCARLQAASYDNWAFINKDLLGTVFGFLSTAERILQVNAVCKHWSSCKSICPSLQFDESKLEQHFEAVLLCYVAKRVKRLDFGNQVNSSILQKLCALSGLQVLSTNYWKLTTDVMHFMVDLSSLQELDLCNSDINAAGIVQMSQMSSLKALFLTGCSKLNDDGFRNLGLLTNLQQLDISHTSVSNAFLDCLTSMRGLKLLKLDSCWNISDDGLKKLAGVTSLETLTIFNTKVTDDTLKFLTTLTLLMELSLGQCASITDAGIKYLEHLPTLSILDISGTSITADGLSILKNLTALKDLDISWCKDIKHSSLQHFLDLSRFCKINIESTELQAFMNESFLLAVASGDIKNVQTLSFRHWVVDAQTFKQEFSAIHIAARRADIAMVVFLAKEMGAQLNLIDWRYRTPIMYAASKGLSDMVQLLGGQLSADLDREDNSISLCNCLKTQ